VKTVVDVDFESVARGINSIDPSSAQDLATKNYVDLRSRRFRTTVAQSSTVVAFANITQLTTLSLPVGSYKFTALIKIRSATTSNGYGLRFQNGSATVSNVIAQWRLPANADFSTNQNIIYSQRALTDNNVAGTIGAANTDYCAVGEGTFTVTAAGTVAIQLRSEAAGTAVTVGIGSCLVVENLT